MADGALALRAERAGLSLEAHRAADRRHRAGGDAGDHARHLEPRLCRSRHRAVPQSRRRPDRAAQRHAVGGAQGDGDHPAVFGRADHQRRAEAARRRAGRFASRRLRAAVESRQRPFCLDHRRAAWRRCAGARAGQGAQLADRGPAAESGRARGAGRAALRRLLPIEAGIERRYRRPAIRRHRRGRHPGRQPDRRQQFLHGHRRGAAARQSAGQLWSIRFSSSSPTWRRPKASRAASPPGCRTPR